jgi:hypothetical protein
MSQLDDFREQLRNSRPEEEEKEQPKAELRTPPAPKKVRRKKESKAADHSSVWLSRDAQRKAKLLTLWMDAEGMERPGSIGDLLEEALDVLIETKYPKAKKYVEMK